MKISVVLSCYNGEKYIVEQLDSLKEQSRMPDEVLIIDDCSKDNTASIVKKYIENNNLNNWIVIINEQNKGWRENFIAGMKMAKGDIIFPCDQDDIWNKNKLEKMAGVMEKDPNILTLVANYVPFYEGEEYRKVSDLFTKNMKFDEKIQKISMNNKALYIYRPGCVMATRKNLIEMADQYRFKEYPHDALLWRTALVLDGLYLYNYEAIKFRRHASNASDKARHKKQDKIEDSQYYIRVSEALKKLIVENGNEKSKIQQLEKIIDFMKVRKKFLQEGKKSLMLKLVFKYHDFYITPKAMLGDIYLAFKE